MLTISDLMPPEKLILDNNIGAGDPKSITDNFDKIGRGLLGMLRQSRVIRPEMHVLDVGCGLGRVARVLTEFLTSGSYTGIDVTKSSIEWCQEHYAGRENFRFYHADVFSTFYNPSSKVSAEEYVFPFDDKSFDLTFSFSLFSHLTIKPSENYLRQIARVLRPGGATYNTFLLLDDISEPLAMTPKTVGSTLRHRVDGGLVAKPENPEILTAMRVERVRAAHEACGLRIIDIKNGKWSSRTDNIRTGLQDDVVALKQI